MEYRRQDKYNLEHPHFHMVLRFLCGLRKLREYPSEVLNTLRFDGKHLVSFLWRCSLCVDRISLNTLYWLFEAQDIIAEVLGSSGIYPYRQLLGTPTPFDYFVLGYCLSHSNCTWTINLPYLRVQDEGVEMLVRGVMEDEIHYTGGIIEINLAANDITCEGVKHLLNFPKQLINKLEILDLSNNKLDSESCGTLACLIPHARASSE